MVKFSPIEHNLAQIISLSPINKVLQKDIDTWVRTKCPTEIQSLITKKMADIQEEKILNQSVESAISSICEHFDFSHKLFNNLTKTSIS